jgi:hypothetical protein
VLEAFFGEGIGRILLSQVECTGSEGELRDCAGLANPRFCLHSEDAGVVCQCKYAFMGGSEQKLQGYLCAKLAPTRSGHI